MNPSLLCGCYGSVYQYQKVCIDIKNYCSSSEPFMYLVWRPSGLLGYTKYPKKGYMDFFSVFNMFKETTFLLPNTHANVLILTRGDNSIHQDLKPTLQNQSIRLLKEC